jgi:hypothetical protein
VRAGDYYTDGTAALSNNVRLWAGSTSRVEQGAVGCRCDEALAFRASHQLPMRAWSFDRRLTLLLMLTRAEIVLFVAGRRF